MHEWLNSKKVIFSKHLKINESNSGHKHNAKMYSSCFQNHFYDESALSRFEVLTKPLHKCNEDRPFYATQYQDFSSNTMKALILYPV